MSGVSGVVAQGERQILICSLRGQEQSVPITAVNEPKTGVEGRSLLVSDRAPLTENQGDGVRE